MHVTVIVPALNEASGIQECLRNATALHPAPEVICVDGGSEDATMDLAGEVEGVRVMQAPKGRAVQMNAGAAAASTSWLLFLHADTEITQQAWTELLAVVKQDKTEWGWFDVRFDVSHWAYRAHAWLITNRARLSGSPTGDQAMFVRRTVFDAVGGFPGIALMEDVALARALRLRGPGCPISAPVITSARRWQRGGLLRTIVRMWFLKLQFLAGRDPNALADAYPHVR